MLEIPHRCAARKHSNNNSNSTKVICVNNNMFYVYLPTEKNSIIQSFTGTEKILQALIRVIPCDKGELVYFRRERTQGRVQSGDGRVGNQLYYFHHTC